MSSEDTDRQAAAYSRYLVGRAPSPEVLALYRSAASSLVEICGRADPLVEFSLRYTWSLGCIDAALALTAPDAPLRRRLFTMFAILETQPQFADEFATFDHTLRDATAVVGELVFSGFQLLTGLLLLRFLRARS